MSTEPNPGSPESDPQLPDPFPEGFLDDLFEEFVSPQEKPALAGLARTVARSSVVETRSAEPPPELASRVLSAVRGEAASTASRSGARATVSDGPDSTVPSHRIGGSTAKDDTAIQVAGRSGGGPFGFFRRFRGRLVVALVALVAAITALFASFGSTPVVAASITLAPVPGSTTPSATGSAEFISPKKGASVNKVTVKVEGLAPNTPGDVYECWLVADDDTPAKPNRIRVGQFKTTSGSVSLDWATTGYAPGFSRMDISLEADDDDPTYGGHPVLSSVSYSGKKTG